MTPNITDIRVPAQSAVRGGATGISAINTILSVIGINLKTLRPMPTVEGYSLPGGYSCQAVRPIALRMVSELGRSLPPNVTLSGMGGVECAEDAIQFILFGSHTVQVCTAAMLQGFPMVRGMIDGLKAFMDEHGFERLEDFRGHSLQYLTTHRDLVHRQVEAKRERAGQTSRDNDWDGDKITRQSDALTSEADVSVPK
jgi:dihydroorotate dehydrogenase